MLFQAIIQRTLSNYFVANPFPQVANTFKILNKISSLSIFLFLSQLPD